MFSVQKKKEKKWFLGNEQGETQKPFGINYGLNYFLIIYLKLTEEKKKTKINY